MVRVDVCCLNSDQAGNVFGCRAEPFSQQLGDDLYELGMKPRKSLQLLRSVSLVRILAFEDVPDWCSCDISSSAPHIPARHI